MIISAYLEEHDWKGQITKYNDLYRSRRDAMLDALEKYLPAEVSYTRPEGGFFIWLTLPQGIDTYALLQLGVQAGVIFIPGAAFSPSKQADNKLRLAFCAVDEATIAEGVQRLSTLLASAIEANAS